MGHYVRDESYFLMVSLPGVQSGRPETQFQRLWLAWGEVLERLTFEAEREWVRRAQVEWRKQQHSQ